MQAWYVLFIIVVAFFVGIIVSALVDVCSKMLMMVFKKYVYTYWVVILIAGLIAPLALGFFGYIYVGQPSCEEYDAGPYQSCISYSDNGYEATSEEKMDRFNQYFLGSSFLLTAIAVASIPRREALEEYLKEQS
jgi:hypothetical protein